MSILKIGDAVMWRGSWGRDAPKEVRVVEMWETEYPAQTHGTPVESTQWDLVRADMVCFILDNGKWAYGEQISEIK